MMAAVTGSGCHHKTARSDLQQRYELGEKAYQQGHYDSALSVLMPLCARYDETESEENQEIYAKSFLRNGNIQYQYVAYSSAMDYYLKAQEIAEMYHFNHLLGEIYGHIGNIYASNNDFESAVNFYKRAYPYAESFCSENEKFCDTNLKSMLLSNLVGTHYFKGEMDSAAHYFQLFKDLNGGDARYRYDVYLNEALVFEGKNQLDSAVCYARKSACYALEHGLSPLCTGSAYSFMANFFEKEEKLDSALCYLHRNETMAKEIGSNELLMATVQELARLYDRLGAHEKALFYKSEYLSLSDSTFNRNEFNSLKNKQIFYELSRNASTIHRLTTIKTLQRNGLLVLGVALAVFLGMMGMLYAQKRRLKSAYMKLYERNQRLLAEEGYRPAVAAAEASTVEVDVACAADVAASDEAAASENPSAERKLLLPPEQRDKIAQAILHVMETTEDWCAPDYGIDKLGAAVDAPSRYVSEVTNEVFGKNFRTLLNEYRIKKAMVRLNDIEHYGHFTIKAVAESVGYKSQATFIAAFTKFTGLKPGLYQKLAGERKKN